jgi:hypothetical protein
MPAQAETRHRHCLGIVITAQAGIQWYNDKSAHMDSRLRGNDGSAVVVRAARTASSFPRRQKHVIAIALASSFPRRRESSGTTTNPPTWIPAYAGMTEVR